MVLSIWSEKKFCKLISNLILGQIIVSNLTNVRKVTAKTKLDFMKPGKKTNIKCNIITHSYQSRCSS